MECGDGPVLVLAGAGSGKTRVLTHRIAHLIDLRELPAERILAVTFTNKAAQEMSERISRLLSSHSGNGLSHLWIGTFHSLCARILRTHAERLGFSSRFTIYDAEDQTAMIRRILEEMSVPPDRLSATYARHRISRAKNDFLSPSTFMSSAEASFTEETISRVYGIYQVRLTENQAMDFDDLLMMPLELFERNPEVLAQYQHRFSHLLVDEFQDTNRAQYFWLKALAGKTNNLFVVGDDDQSIYRWRGADVRNILNFERDYPHCKTFRLEQNYRSTSNILAAAHSVIMRNRRRLDKQLWTEREEGEKVLLLEAMNEFHEAQIVLDKISEEFSNTGDDRNYRRSFRDFAILYRTNAQSRLLEDMLRRSGIPYVIVGGLRFYERKEVKDILAYLRLIANPSDSVSLRRIINYPLRGIGETTIKRLEEFGREKKITLFEAVGRAAEIPLISDGLQNKVLAFRNLIMKYVHLRKDLSVTEWCSALVDEINVIQMLKKEGAQDRIDNIRELLNAIAEYASQIPNATIDGYLEQVSLVTDIDNWDNKSNAVTLMTLHSAKGLEFPIVFITGLEEGLFPLVRTDDEDPDIEEERRLFYVGATRAKEKLYLSLAHTRSRFSDERQSKTPSRFIAELDQRYVDHASVRRQRFQQHEDTSEAAETFTPAYEDESQETDAIRPGRWVQHASFGRGRILTVEGRGENLKLAVEFEEVGTKKILVKYANLRFI